MAHFAKLGNNNIVQSVEVVHNDIATTEKNGAAIANASYSCNGNNRSCSNNINNNKITTTSSIIRTYGQLAAASRLTHTAQHHLTANPTKQQEY